MEVLAGIVTVIQLCSAVGQRIAKVAGASKARTRLLSQVDVCKGILTSLEARPSDLNKCEDWSKILDVLNSPNGPLSSLRSTLQLVTEKLGPDPSSQSRVQKSLQNINGFTMRVKSRSSSIPSNLTRIYYRLHCHMTSKGCSWRSRYLMPKLRQISPRCSKMVRGLSRAACRRYTHFNLPPKVRWSQRPDRRYWIGYHPPTMGRNKATRLIFDSPVPAPGFSTAQSSLSGRRTEARLCSAMECPELERLYSCLLSSVTSWTITLPIQTSVLRGYIATIA